LDANLWPFVAEDIVDSLLYSRMTCIGTLLTSFHESWKLTRIFQHNLASPVSGGKYNRQCTPCSWTEATYWNRCDQNV